MKNPTATVTPMLFLSFSHYEGVKPLRKRSSPPTLCGLIKSKAITANKSTCTSSTVIELDGQPHVTPFASRVKTALNLTGECEDVKCPTTFAYTPCVDPKTRSRDVVVVPKNVRDGDDEQCFQSPLIQRSVILTSGAFDEVNGLLQETPNNLDVGVTPDVFTSCKMRHLTSARNSDSITESTPIVCHVTRREESEQHTPFVQCSSMSVRCPSNNQTPLNGLSTQTCKWDDWNENKIVYEDSTPHEYRNHTSTGVAMSSMCNDIWTCPRFDTQYSLEWSQRMATPVKPELSNEDGAYVENKTAEKKYEKLDDATIQQSMATPVKSGMLNDDEACVEIEKAENSYKQVVDETINVQDASDICNAQIVSLNNQPSHNDVEIYYSTLSTTEEENSESVGVNNGHRFISTSSGSADSYTNDTLKVLDLVSHQLESIGNVVGSVDGQFQRISPPTNKRSSESVSESYTSSPSQKRIKLSCDYPVQTSKENHKSTNYAISRTNTSVSPETSQLSVSLLEGSFSKTESDEETLNRNTGNDDTTICIDGRILSPHVAFSEEVQSTEPILEDNHGGECIANSIMVDVVPAPSIRVPFPSARISPEDMVNNDSFFPESDEHSGDVQCYYQEEQPSHQLHKMAIAEIGPEAEAIKDVSPACTEAVDCLTPVLVGASYNSIHHFADHVSMKSPAISQATYVDTHGGEATTKSFSDDLNIISGTDSRPAAIPCELPPSPVQYSRSSSSSSVVFDNTAIEAVDMVELGEDTDVLFRSQQSSNDTDNGDTTSLTTSLHPDVNAKISSVPVPQKTLDIVQPRFNLVEEPVSGSVEIRESSACTFTTKDPKIDSIALNSISLIPQKGQPQNIVHCMQESVDVITRQFDPILNREEDRSRSVHIKLAVGMKSSVVRSSATSTAVDSNVSAAIAPFTNFDGFTMGNGKKVVVDRSALQRVKQQFKEITAITACDNISSSTVDSYMSGRSPTISPSATSTGVDSNVSGRPSTIAPSTNFDGFTMGNGKKVVVDKSALQRARQQFKEMTATNACDNISSSSATSANMSSSMPVSSPVVSSLMNLGGFTMGNGKPVSVDKIVLEAMQRRFGDEFSSPNDDSASTERARETTTRSLPGKRSLARMTICQRTPYKAYQQSPRTTPFQPNNRHAATSRGLSNYATSHKKSNQRGLVKAFRPPWKHPCSNGNVELTTPTSESAYSTKFATKTRSVNRISAGPSHSSAFMTPLPKWIKPRSNCDSAIGSTNATPIRPEHATKWAMGTGWDFQFHDVEDFEDSSVDGELSPAEVDYDVSHDHKFIIVDNTSFEVKEWAVDDAILNLPDVNPRLVPDGWVNNHFRWICLELIQRRTDTVQNALTPLTVDNVVMRLKYRYQRELCESRRSALRKILEKDESSGRLVVLFVSAINIVGCEKTSIQLSDGWYSIEAYLDDMLHERIRNGTIRLGSKLCIQDAEVVSGVDAEQRDWRSKKNFCAAVSPLDFLSCSATDTKKAPVLKIHTNGTRQARWDSMLGHQKLRGIPIILNTIVAKGGIVSRVDVLVMRIYPVYYKTVMNGQTSIQSKSMYDEAEDKENARRSLRLQALLEESRHRKSENHSGQDIRLDIVQIARSAIDKSDESSPTEEISSLLDQCNGDEDVILSLLTQQQQRYYFEYRDAELARMQEADIAAARKQLDEEELSIGRRVSPSFDIRVVDYNSFEGARPPQHYRIAIHNLHAKETIAEGKRVVLSTLRPSVGRGDTIRLNWTYKSTVQDVRADESTCAKLFEPRRFTAMQTMKELSAGEEFDTVGVVVSVGSPMSEGSTMETIQDIFLTDQSGTMSVMRCHGGLSGLGCLNSVVPKAVVALLNLTYKTYDDHVGLYVCDARLQTQVIHQNRFTRLDHLKVPWEDLCKLSRDCFFLDKTGDCKVHQNLHIPRNQPSTIDSNILTGADGTIDARCTPFMESFTKLEKMAQQFKTPGCAKTPELLNTTT
eukprot:CFRG6828T1